MERAGLLKKRSGKKTVMIVEDDEDIQHSLKEALEAEGYATVTASNGQIALEILSQMESPDVIFLDLMMPQMDGLEFRNRQMVDPRLAQIPTVVLSADSDIKRKVSALNVSGHLTKPVDLEHLYQIADKFCRNT